MEHLKKFKTMDMQWSIIEEDKKLFIHLVVPGESNVEYDFNLEETKKMVKNLGQLIATMEHSAFQPERERLNCHRGPVPPG